MDPSGYSDNLLSLLLGDSTLQFPYKPAISYAATFDGSSSFLCNEKDTTTFD